MHDAARELRFTAESLDDSRIGGEERMEHLERHLALELQITHVVHAAEATGAEFSEQFVIVAQGPP